jgi:hypothetical protein
MAHVAKALGQNLVIYITDIKTNAAERRKLAGPSRRSAAKVKKPVRA